MMYLVRILIPIIALGAVIAFTLSLYISSGEDPCIDSETFGEYQACQFLKEAEDRCKDLKGTEIYTQCLFK